ncbi:MAG: hypothetical protein QXY47_05375 [Thermoplasmata archaeon]
MKTKKEILEWWESLGKKVKNNDYKEFTQKISDEVSISLIDDGIRGIEKGSFGLKLWRKQWKYPIVLFFNNNECYRIIGF